MHIEIKDVRLLLCAREAMVRDSDGVFTTYKATTKDIARAFYSKEECSSEELAYVDDRLAHFSKVRISDFSLDDVRTEILFLQGKSNSFFYSEAPTYAWAGEPVLLGRENGWILHKPTFLDFMAL